MTYLKYAGGNRYSEYEGPAWSVLLYLWTGQRFGPLKVRPRYKGTKADIKARKHKQLWRKLL